MQPGVWTGTHWTGSGPELISINPSTGEALGRVQTATPSDYEAVVLAAQEAAALWARVPAPQRGEAMRLVGEALRAAKDRLGTLVAQEMGKIKAEGDGEVQEMIDIADFAVGLSRMLYGKSMHSERPEHRMFEQWHPLGVIGVITAFNFPVAVWAWNACIAAVCGNVTIWRPSPHTPLCSIEVQRICNAALADAGLPPIFFLVIDAGVSLAERMADDRRLPLLSFTGSSAVGRGIASRVGARLGRSLLELGGNNAVIVQADADLELVVRALLFGAVGTAGQRCTSTRRVLVARGIADTLAERLAKAYATVPIGDPTEPGTLMGPLITPAAVERYQATIAKAVKEGGQVLCGGAPLQRPGNFVQPTIIRMPAQTDIVCEETFAPILYIIAVDDLEEAIALNNAVPQGLSSALFTGDLRRAERFLSAAGSDCGIANVNIGTSGAETGGAFGGEKDTGGGREAGSDAWKAYMRRQTCTINYGTALPLAQGIVFETS
jgi:aldehyde dehydrogenase (NAD+)